MRDRKVFLEVPSERDSGTRSLEPRIKGLANKPQLSSPSAAEPGMGGAMHPSGGLWAGA